MSTAQYSCTRAGCQSITCSSAGDGHRHQREVGAFADVVADRAGLVVVAVVDQLLEVLAAGAANPGFFERLAAVEPRPEVGEAERVGAHQPLVGGARPARRAGRRRRRRAARPPTGCRRRPARRPPRGRGANGFEVEPGAVGPVHVPDGDDGGARCRWPRGRGRSSSRRGRRAAVGRMDGAQLHALRRRQLAPAVDVGRELLVGDDEVLAARHRQVPRGDGQAVGRGRDDRDARRIGGIHQAREQGPGPVGLGEEVVRAEPRRHALASPRRRTPAASTALDIGDM